jgi:hypothetical protein
MRRFQKIGKGNFMKQALLLALILGQILPHLAFANVGGLNGGGADVAIRDDQVVLADPYGTIRDQRPLSYEEAFSPELRYEFTLVSLLAGAYSDLYKERTYLRDEYRRIIERSKTTIIGSKLDELVTNPDIEYSLVDELPRIAECSRVVDYPGLQNGEKIARVACTVGSQTWIVKSLFQKLSLGDQAITLAHEGLRRLNTDDQTVFRITSGLRITLALLTKEWNGEFPQLTEIEMYRIKDSARAALKLESLSQFKSLRANDTVESTLAKYIIWPLGGGWVHKEATVASDAKIGVLTRLANGSRVEQGATLSMTNVCDPIEAKCTVQANAIVAQSTFERAENIVVPSGVEIRGSQIIRAKLQMAEGTKILRSKVWAARVEMEGNSLLQDSEIGVDVLTLKRQAQIIANTNLLVWGKATLGEGAILRGVVGAMGYENNIALNMIFFITTLNFGNMLINDSKNIDFPAHAFIDGKGVALCPKNGQYALDIVFNEPFRKQYSFSSVEDIRNYCAVKN